MVMHQGQEEIFDVQNNLSQALYWTQRMNIKVGYDRFSTLSPNLLVLCMHLDPIEFQ
jgi:hypothetical protein